MSGSNEYKINEATNRHNYNDKATSNIQVNGLITESFSYNIGVRQGCPFSPILFILYSYLRSIIERKKKVPGLTHTHSWESRDSYT